MFLHLPDALMTIAKTLNEANDLDVVFAGMKNTSMEVWVRNGPTGKRELFCLTIERVDKDL